jgi:hypothetical protein
VGTLPPEIELEIEMSIVPLSFGRATRQCRNLVAIHKRAGGGSGLRERESINRAIVVMAIASWQAFIEDLALVLCKARMLALAGQNDDGSARRLDREIKQRVRTFSTPSPVNTRTLLQLVGYDPQPYWTWRTRVGRSGQRVVRHEDVEKRLKEWLKVRHAIAHGDVDMPKLQVLQAVRNQEPMRKTDGAPIRLVDAQQCLAFLTRLVAVTSQGAGIKPL